MLITWQKKIIIMIKSPGSFTIYKCSLYVSQVYQISKQYITKRVTCQTEDRMFILLNWLGNLSWQNNGDFLYNHSSHGKYFSCYKN